MARQCALSQRMMQLAGVGETTATAIVAMVGNASEFDSGRQFAAWLGLVPGQYSSGGKTRLGRITKAGDAYLRSLLVLGARAMLNAAQAKSDSLSRWHWRWPSGEATGRRWWPLRRRTRAWPGPC
jgi:transposase